MCNIFVFSEPPVVEVSLEDTIQRPSTTSEPQPGVTLPGPGRGKRHIEPLPAQGSTSSESTDESESTEGGPSSEVPRASEEPSGPSLSRADQKALVLLPLITPFLEEKTGLGTLVKPLGEASRKVGETELVALLSRAKGSELNIAVERAAYQV
ncbi:hypothetical protein GUJ93_ZPchr0009g1936 [Zizania palustris]|uniref:Uncharacterized protein n=1 Tax=Zizania palustris TaxID=103762 RepID=A0A8J5RX82_ZIZPA|nr:hypothetical protein GUJ93_ZPchr0009g1936 [Zizania palustris]